MWRFDGRSHGGRSTCRVGRQDVVDGEAVEGDRLTVDDKRGTSLGLSTQLTRVRRTSVRQRCRSNHRSSLAAMNENERMRIQMFNVQSKTDRKSV